MTNWAQIFTDLLFCAYYDGTPSENTGLRHLPKVFSAFKACIYAGLVRDKNIIIKFNLKNNFFFHCIFPSEMNEYYSRRLNFWKPKVNCKNLFCFVTVNFKDNYVYNIAEICACFFFLSYFSRPIQPNFLFVQVCHVMYCGWSNNTDSDYFVSSPKPALHL